MAEPLESYSIPALNPPEVPYETVKPVIAKLKSEPPHSISMEEARLLLGWTVGLTLKGLEQLYDSNRNWTDPTGGALPNVKTRVDESTGIYITRAEEDYYHGHPPDHWGKYITNKCLEARDLADAVLGEVPKSLVTSIHTNSFSHTNHGILLLKLPIEENGKVSEKHFLVDTTIAQFFYKDNEDDVQDRSHMVGERLLAGNEAFARDLVSHGFAELSEENAKLYVKALDLEIRKPRVKEAMKTCGDSYLDFLKHPAIATTRVHELPSRY